MNVIDLFSGAGGFSLGFEFAGSDVLAAFDYEARAIETYNANRVDDHGHVEDLFELTPADAEADYNLSPDDVDVIAGGPPCQSFSIIGQRDPNDERDDLTHRYFDWVAWFDPDVFVTENVPGLETKNDGQVLDDLLETGRDMGYEMHYKVLRADDYDVHQKRKRLFVVGDKTGAWEWPEPTTADATMACITVLDAITEVAPVVAGENINYPNHDGPGANSSTKQKYRNTPHKKDPYDHDAYKQVRLDPLEPANTIKASNRHFHPYIARRLTVHEMAALQSFPSDYWFKGNEGEMQRQVGNAVPPHLGLTLAESVQDALDGDAVASTPTTTGQTSLHEFSRSD